MTPISFDYEVISAVLSRLDLDCPELEQLPIHSRKDFLVAVTTEFLPPNDTRHHSAEPVGGYYLYNRETDHAIGILLELFDGKPVCAEIFSHGSDELPQSITGYSLLALKDT